MRALPVLFVALPLLLFATLTSAAEPEITRLSRFVATGDGENQKALGPIMALSGNRVAFPEANLRDGEIVVADATTGEVLARLRHPLDAKIKWKQMALNIAMNERFIVSAGHTESYYPGSRRHGEFLVFDAQSFEHLHTIRSPDDAWVFGFGGGMMQLDGARLLMQPISFTRDGQKSVPLYLFDLETGDLVWALADKDKQLGFGMTFSMQGEHVLLQPGSESGYGADHVALYKIGSDEPVATFRSPETMEGSAFGGPLLLTEDLVLIGGSVPSKVRVLLNHYASVGKLYAFERDGGALRYTVADPFPVPDDAQPAAYVAAMGGKGYYGSGFPGGVVRMGERFVAGLPNYRSAPNEEGGLFGLDAATGERAFLFTRDEGVTGENYALLYEADGDKVAVYHSVTVEGVKRDAISVFRVE